MTSVSPYLFDIVCVYNDPAVLNELLLSSLERESSDLYSLHLVDNTQGVFSCAADAFNHALPQCRGRWVMFVHQDVAFLETDWLRHCAGMLLSIEPFGVAGVAGMVPTPKIYNMLRGRNIVHTGASLQSGEFWPWGKRIALPERVQTVDELLFVVPRKLLDLMGFQPKVTPGWHLYAVNCCLDAAAFQGQNTYVLPLPIYHRSSGINKSKWQIFKSLGPLPGDYYRTLKYVTARHRPHCPVIYTTCSHWHTHCPIILQRVWKLSVGFWDMLAVRWFHAPKNRN